MTADKPDSIQNQLLSTFFSLRLGTGIIGVLFPIVLALGGWLHASIPLQNSLSAYYHAVGVGGITMRDWFVGGLFALAACLYLYKGFTEKENIALNIAGVFAVCIAVNPMAWNCDGNCPKINIHGASAVIFFLCIAFVAVFCGDDTLGLIDDKMIRMRYKRVYKGLAALMVVSPLTVVAFNALQKFETHIFVVEVVGIYAFAAYWFTKSRELAFSSAEKRVLKNNLPPGQPAEEVAA